MSYVKTIINLNKYFWKKSNFTRNFNTLFIMFYNVINLLCAFDFVTYFPNYILKILFLLLIFILNDDDKRGNNKQIFFFPQLIYVCTYVLLFLLYKQWSRVKKIFFEWKARKNENCFPPTHKFQYIFFSKFKLFVYHLFNLHRILLMFFLNTLRLNVCIHIHMWTI